MRWTRGIAVASLAVALAAGAARAETTVKFVPHADLKIIDTTWSNALITTHYGYMIHENLFAMTFDLEPKPQAVESWERSADGLTWSFRLRPMRFSDGSPVTARDAVASLTRWARRRVDGQAMMAAGAALEARDDRTFEIRFKGSFAPVLQTLANPVLPTFIWRAQDVQGDAFQQQNYDKVIGSGPFVFEKDQWVPGAKVVYAKNPAYVPRTEPADGFAGAKIVKVDRVEWLNLPDSATAAQALSRGEVDIVEAPQPDLVASLAKDPNIKVQVIDPMGTQGLIRPNALFPPFNHPKARQAIAMLIDQKAYLAAIAGREEYARPCHAVLICGGPYETAAGAEPFRERDVARARQLLAEAGYKGEPVVLMGPTNIDSINAIAVITAQNLRDAGVNVDLQLVDWGVVSTRNQKKDPPGPGSQGWNLYVTTAPGSLFHTPLTNFAVATPCDGKNWNGWTCDEALEKIRVGFMTAEGREAQMKVVEAFQKGFYEAMPFIPVGQFLTPKAWRANIVGMPRSREIVMWGLEKK
jgi:peptide/nickel transport system substrate-binding protein